MGTETIVFFDGYCGLCSGVVDFMIERDLNRKLVYAPLQGETARAFLSEQERNDLDSVVVVTRTEHGETLGKFHKSDAVLEGLSRLSVGWSGISQAARIFPRTLRDAVYDLIARNRFKLFGRRETCRAPTAEERKLFLP